METKTFNCCAAQGDIFIMRIESIPKKVKSSKGKFGKHVVAHSETGHHHTITTNDVDFFIGDELTSYLDVKAPFALLRHERPFDTHLPLKIRKGKYIIKRQREYIPEGWQIVHD